MGRRYVQDSFYFPQALGERLRELRLRAGLTQKELASMAGREFRGGQAMVSRLERGRIRSPSLRLVADFLRACRASFDDIRDVLHAYTAQPLVAEKRARRAVQRLVEVLPEGVAGRWISTM